MQTGDRDDANSVQGFGNCVGDKHSFCWLLAISYIVVMVTTHMNKLTLFRLTNHSETSCCSHRVCTSAVNVTFVSTSVPELPGLCDKTSQLASQNLPNGQ